MVGLSGDELRSLILSVGTHRNERPLSPMEVSRLLQKALRAGATRSDLRNELQVGATAVARFLRLQQLTPELQHIADWGGSSQSGIAFSALSEIAKLPGPDQPIVGRAVLEHRLTWNEVVQVVQIAERSNLPIEDVIEKVLRRRPEIERRHVFIGAITDPKLSSRLATLSQAERDQLLRRSIARIAPGLEGHVQGKLGPQKFTIVGTVDPAAITNRSADEFEADLNRNLESEIHNELPR